MTWPHFIDFLTVLFGASVILLFLGCLRDERADRHAKVVRGSLPAAAPRISGATMGGAAHVPAPRHGADIPV